jgi:spore germination protein KA
MLFQDEVTLMKEKANNQEDSKKLSCSLSENVDLVKNRFAFPSNQDLVLRDIFISILKRNCTLIYIDGIVDENFINEHIIEPLCQMLTSSECLHGMDLIKNTVSLAKVTSLTTIGQLSQNLLQGNTLLLIDGFEEALSIGTISYEKRSIGRPDTENVLKGPHEGFIESSKVNRSLIRKQLKSEKLISESILIGRNELYRVTFMYMQDLADPQLVADVKDRVQQIDSDGLLTISTVGEHIEESSYSIVPTVLYTERPDRAAAFIAEGHVIILMDNSPACLIAPATFWAFFHTPEDMYQRTLAGNFLRFLRVIAVLITLTTPAVYIAITNYHQEMIPTDLLLAIASSRERVPFPVIFEVIGMEIAFELIRESSIRIPPTIGSTIGIVGALILGQAAVEANIISPILVIVIATTGVCSFIISNVDLNLSLRIARFFFLLCGMLMGFLGIGIGTVAFAVYVLSIKSFGIPYFAPVTPHYSSSKDTLARPPAWKQWLRPQFTRPQYSVRKKPRKGE